MTVSFYLIIIGASCFPITLSIIGFNYAAIVGIIARCLCQGVCLTLLQILLHGRIGLIVTLRFFG